MLAKHPKLKVKQAVVKLVPEGRCLSHAAVRRLVDQATDRSARQVVIDLDRVEDATTSAFAELVLLRRSLLAAGGDLRLTNLRDRAAGLFEVNRLEAVLPTM
jgi:anti-anti-sigma regulatory factor